MRAIERVGVIGAGTMGNGIAQACATAGVDVVMVDVAQPALDRGVAAIGGSLDGLQTSDATIDAVRAFAQRLGKTPIVVRNSPGFVVNRILCPMINEAIFALQEGLASAEDIDNGMRLGCNHPIGPLALADMIGLDVLLAVMNVFYADFNDPKYRPAPLLKEMVAAGYLGRKTKRGFYRYD